MARVQDDRKGYNKARKRDLGAFIRECKRVLDAGPGSPKCTPTAPIPQERTPPNRLKRRRAFGGKERVGKAGWRTDQVLFSLKRLLDFEGELACSAHEHVDVGASSVFRDCAQLIACCGKRFDERTV